MAEPQTNASRQTAFSMALRICKWMCIALLVIVLILAIAIWVAIGTERGRLWLADTAISVANRSDSMQITAQGLLSPELGRWQFTSLQILRDQQAWLDAESFDLVWQPKALLSRQIVVDRLQLRQLEIHTGIDISESEPEQRDSSGLPDLEALNLPEVNIQGFELGRLSILPPISNDPAENDQHRPIPDIQLSGEARAMQDAPIFVELDARLTGISPTNIHVEITEESTQQIRLEGSMQEPANGYIGSLIKLPDGQAIDASFEIIAAMDDSGYQLDLRTLNLPIANRDLTATGALGFSSDFSRIDLADLIVRIDDTQHRVDGSLDNQDIDFSLTIDRFPLDLLNTFDLLRYQDAALQTGNLSGDIGLTGTIAAPHFSAKAQLDTQYKGEILAAQFTGQGDLTSVSVDQLKVAWSEGNLVASGTLDIAADTSEFDVEAENIDLSLLRDFGVDVPAGLGAIITSAKGQIRGNLKDPDLALATEIQGQYRDQRFDLSADIEKLQSILTVEELILLVNESRSFADGTVNLDTLVGDIRINTEPFSIEMVEMVGLALPQGLNGILEGRASLSGDLRNPQVSADLSLAGEYQSIPYLALARGSRIGKVINIGTLNISTFESEVLDVKGTIDESNIDLTLKADRLPTRLISAAGFNIRPGEFTANFRALGPITLPQVQGDMSYKADFFGYNSEGTLESIELGWQLGLETIGENYMLRSEFSRAGERSGELLVNVPAKPYMNLVNSDTGAAMDELPLNLELNGDFSLQTLSFFLDPEIHRIEGDVSTALKVNGTLATPEFHGDVRFQNAYYNNPISGTEIDNLNCLILAQRTQFDFDECTASDGGTGGFEILGNLTLPLSGDSGEIDLELSVDQASIIDRPEIESEATGNIQVQGDFKSLLAKGALEVAPLEASIDANISSGIPKIEVEKVQSIADYNGRDRNKNAVAPIVNLDLLITASRQAYIRGRGLEAELRGEIYLKGTASDPKYEGEFNTVRGEFEIFGKTFELQEGLVNFANNAIGLSIQGVYDRKGQSVTALISGTIDDLDVSLSAQPSMSEDEILAFIIFGKSVQSITPFETIQLASAVQQLRGGGGGLMDPIGAARNALGVDSLSIESETLDDDSTGVNVGVGKYLNEKVYLEIERSPNPSQPWRGSLEIELTPNLNLESSTGGSTGIEGAEIKWKRDY